MKQKNAIEPGIYRSRIANLPGRLRVHHVSETHVYFKRAGMHGMSISTIESFVGIVDLSENPLKQKMRPRS